MNNEENLLFYFKITDLWKRLCEEHQSLFELSCEEYSHLLGSEVEELEPILEQKVVIIEQINELERYRQELIDEINATLDSNKQIDSINDLIGYMAEVPVEKESGHLLRFNDLLISLIESIQEQNKRNQIFINKAIRSLKELRQTAMGEKGYETYNSKGSTANVK